MFWRTAWYVKISRPYPTLCRSTPNLNGGVDRSLDAKEKLLNQKDRVIAHRDAVIEKLSHELAILKRHKYAQRSEQMNNLQASLLDELVEGDLAAIEIELAQFSAVDAPTQAKKNPNAHLCLQNYHAR